MGIDKDVGVPLLPVMIVIDTRGENRVDGGRVSSRGNFKRNIIKSKFRQDTTDERAYEFICRI